MTFFATAKQLRKVEINNWIIKKKKEHITKLTISYFFTENETHKEMGQLIYQSLDR